MMIDLAGSEEIALKTFAERAIADDRHARPPPRIRALDTIVVKHEPRPTVVAGGRA